MLSAAYVCPVGLRTSFTKRLRAKLNSSALQCRISVLNSFGRDAPPAARDASSSAFFAVTHCFHAFSPYEYLSLMPESSMGAWITGAGGGPLNGSSTNSGVGTNWSSSSSSPSTAIRCLLDTGSESISLVFLSPLFPSKVIHKDNNQLYLSLLQHRHMRKISGSSPNVSKYFWYQGWYFPKKNIVTNIVS